MKKTMVTILTALILTFGTLAAATAPTVRGGHQSIQPTDYGPPISVIGRQ